MATIKADGQTLYFTRPKKASDDPALLLIHGAGGTHLDWPKQIQRIPGTVVYNLDLPGHGRSEGPGRTSINDYADVVQDFMEVLALRDVTIVGHSMGGAIAQTVALRGLPQMVKMVLIGTSARLRVSPEVLNATYTDPDLAVDIILRMSWDSGEPTDLADKGKMSLRQIHPAVLEGDLWACDGFDIRPILSQINVPTLVITGTADKMTPLKHGRYLAENIAGARLITIEGAGHFLMLQEPEKVADAIAEFLGKRKA